MRSEEEINGMVDYLNGLAALDAGAVTHLFESRVQCNTAMANHKTVQATRCDGLFYVGLLGIINGYLGVYSDTHPNTFLAGKGPITAYYDSAGVVVKVIRTDSIKAEEKS